MTAPESDPAQKNWKTFVAHRPDVRIQNLDLFKDFAVLVEKGNALDHLRVHDFKTGKWREIEYPEPVYSVFPGGTPDFESHTYRAITTRASDCALRASSRLRCRLRNVDPAQTGGSPGRI